ncbi:MAG: flippase [Clostridium sp.]|uniref:flippase n=1 Tax=Clostridium sp. TaxID=1506 RepID=UPI0025BBAB19|nr:flippase [Clostridium sp.]MCF0149643.1 flippase [Clostridium sp.]
MSVIKNYIYNTLYQVMILFIPLITMPYLARVFSPELMGVNTLSLTIATYFTMVGQLGMQMYGNRQIAYVRDDKKKLSTVFWSLYIIQVISCSLALIAYYLYVYFRIDANKVIYLIQGLNVINVLLDISWLFIGLEDFKKVVIRNTIVKFVGLVSILIFVRDSGDLAIYTFLTVAVNIVGMLTMWIYVPKYVGKINIDFKFAKKSIAPLLKLFLPQIASTVYLLLDKSMLGEYSTAAQVAFYDYSQKLIRVILAVIASVGTVLMPRVSNLMGNGKKEEVGLIIEKTFKFISYLAMPTTIGFMCVSEKLVPYFLGEAYAYSGFLSAVCSLIIIAVSWANIIAVQYLIATKQEDKYTVSVIASGILSFIMNLFLLRKYGALGAVISLIAAEYLGIGIQMFLVRRQLPVTRMLKGTIRYLIAAIAMGVPVYIVGTFIEAPLISTIVQGIVGVIVYVLIMFVIKDNVQKEIIEKGISLLRKRKVTCSEN